MDKDSALIILYCLLAISILMVIGASFYAAYLYGRLSALAEARTIMEEGQKELKKFWDKKTIESELLGIGYMGDMEQ